MAVKIFCRPLCMDLYWITSFANSSAERKTLHTNEDDVFIMTFHNVSVKVNGSITSLRLKDLTREDFGTYTVVAENSVNTSYCFISLKEKGLGNYIL